MVFDVGNNLRVACLMDGRWRSKKRMYRYRYNRYINGRMNEV
jgi:hypothetical protein